MKKTLFIALFVLLAGGCASTMPMNEFGSFATITPEQNQFLVTDALQTLIPLYPPAKTAFSIKSAPVDEFGQTLVRLLRESGYALLEGVTEPTATRAEPLEYIVDQPEGLGVLRVTIFAGTQSFSRPYAPDDSGRLQPAGNWAVLTP